MASIPSSFWQSRRHQMHCNAAKWFWTQTCLACWDANRSTSRNSHCNASLHIHWSQKVLLMKGSNHHAGDFLPEFLNFKELVEKLYVQNWSEVSVWLGNHKQGWIKVMVPLYRTNSVKWCKSLIRSSSFVNVFTLPFSAAKWKVKLFPNCLLYPAISKCLKCKYIKDNINEQQVTYFGVYWTFKSGNICNSSLQL